MSKQLTQLTKGIMQELRAIAERYESRMEQGDEDCPYCNACAEGCEPVVSYQITPNTAVSMNIGPFNATDWRELVQCQACHEFFWRENNNY
ncbi:MAG: hypothetical protein GY832_44485 [Chloroflexi bacterium]|nr:hypothetical protein [Chloroflexota bacterium]